MKIDIRGFQRFINEYLNKHRITKTDLARRAGLYHSTLNASLKKDSPQIPSNQTVFMLSEAMGVEPLTLMSTLYPELARTPVTDAAIADRYNRLSEEQ